MPTNTDNIIAEIRNHREEYAASLDYDLKRIIRDFQRQERESGRKVVGVANMSNQRRTENGQDSAD